MVIILKNFTLFKPLINAVKLLHYGVEETEYKHILNLDIIFIYRKFSNLLIISKK